jgi:hypothetical protein
MPPSNDTANFLRQIDAVYAKMGKISAAQVALILSGELDRNVTRNMVIGALYRRQLNETREKAGQARVKYRLVQQAKAQATRDEFEEIRKAARAKEAEERHNRKLEKEYQRVQKQLAKQTKRAKLDVLCKGLTQAQKADAVILAVKGGYTPEEAVKIATAPRVRVS